MNTASIYLKQKSIVLLVLLFVFVLFDLTLGSVSVSFTDLWNSFFDYDANSNEELTVRAFRIPRVLTAVLAGIALSVSGLLMQTLFQNPLAGPYVLGINSGSSLMVALSTMTGFSLFANDFGLVGAALIGAFGAGLFILFCSLYVKNKVSLLLVGIMFGSFAGALVNVVQSYSNPDDLKMFMLWSFGSLQNVQLDQLSIFTGVVFTGIFLTLFIIKPLNLLVLGDQNATTLGVRIKSVRFLIILITAILTGTVTAFCGPIAFVGLIVPNIVKLVYKTTNHFHLLLGSMLGGALLIVICDVLMQLLQSYVHLPLNALTALMGAPIVVWIIIKRF